MFVSCRVFAERLAQTSVTFPGWILTRFLPTTDLLKPRTPETNSGPGFGNLCVTISTMFTPTAKISIDGDRSAGIFRTSGGI